MRFGALITAAGMSSRMGQFKPMLSIGSISVAQRVVANFRQAGAERIVMVTGYNAVALERHLAGNGVVFLRNEDYATTQMFDSVKIGLRYLRDKCDAVLLTPVDIPLFTAGTVTALMESGAKLACPECDGQTGHPILIHTDLIETILSDSGSQGLRGALERCGEPMRHIPVSDQGTLHDADTPEDYSALLAFHNSQLVRPEVSVSLNREKPFFDSKIAMLLTLVDETKSVRKACQRMQISYSTGWNIIRTLESQLRYPLILRTQGGAGGSTSMLSDRGRELLTRFNAYQQSLRDRAAELYDWYFGELFL